MDEAGLVLGIVGALPVLAYLYTVARRRRTRRVLGITGKRGVDAVVTTSARTKSSHGRAAVRRSLAPEGELQAIAAAANSLGQYAYNTRITIHVSARVSGKLDRDLIVFGGPAGNSVAGQLLADLGIVHGKVSLDADSCSVHVGDWRTDGFDLRLQAGVPQRDLGLVVVGRNPWGETGQERAIVCAGLTTYGTGAAADYFFQCVARRDAESRELRRLLRRGKPLALVVEASFSNGYLTTSRLQHWQAL